MKACKTIRVLLALRTDDWSEHERRQVQLHLEACQGCTALARSYAEQERLFRGTAETASGPPQWDPLWERIQKQKRWGKMRFRLGTVLTSAAVVAAIIGLVWGLSPVFERIRRPVQPSEPASTGPATTAVATVTATASPTETPLPPATPTSTTTAVSTKAADSECPLPPDATAFDYGIEAYTYADLDRVVATIEDLNFGWLKQEIRWLQIEPVQGQYEWAELDEVVEASSEAGIKVLLTIVDAPVWARDGELGAGPPKDVQDLADFVRATALRYRTKVHAYEIWHEQNVKHSWEGQALSAEGYVELLRASYHAIKEADPEAIVVSGAPMPTGVNDGEWAIDDRAYLQQMYDAGLKYFCDAVGAHPGGYANPPDVYYAGGDLDPNRLYDDHPTFFFRNTMEDYYRIIAANGDADKHVWATEFGWGTPDGLGMEVSPGYVFVNDVDEQQQAAYIVGAYAWAEGWGHAGAMFLFNLNVSPTRSDLGLVYSIVYQDWSPRPAYRALKEINAFSIPEDALQGTGAFVWPAVGRVSEKFGPRPTDGCWHGGLDIATAKGTAVYAADSGLVTFAGLRGSYGNLVIVDHLNGFETAYAHLDKISVSAGASVQKGDILGAVGKTGVALGPHLHFEIREKGVRVDPMLYLP
jgi:hypothetical protein